MTFFGLLLLLACFSGISSDGESANAGQPNQPGLPQSQRANQNQQNSNSLVGTLNKSPQNLQPSNTGFNLGTKAHREDNNQIPGNQQKKFNDRELKQFDGNIAKPKDKRVQSDNAGNMPPWSPRDNMLRENSQDQARRLDKAQGLASNTNAQNQRPLGPAPKTQQSQSTAIKPHEGNNIHQENRNSPAESSLQQPVGQDQENGNSPDSSKQAAESSRQQPVAIGQDQENGYSPESSKQEEQQNELNPKQDLRGDAPGEGHFMALFIISVVLIAIAYLIYHNRKKIQALIIEGRNGWYRRNSSSRRDRTHDYSKLHNNVSEVLDLERSSKATIY